MLRKISTYIACVALIAAVVSSCKKEYTSIEAIDEQNIQDYIRANNLNMTKYTFNDTSEFYYQVITPGGGADIQYSQKVPLVLSIKSLDNRYASLDTFSISNRYANYLGYFPLEPVRLAVNEVLKQKNGKVRVLIPSRFAYGRNGTGSIPGNASLDIEVSVLDETKMPEYEDYVIQEYLERSNLTGFTKSTTGVYYKIITPGTGSSITVDSTITAKYTGKLLNGSVFDESESGVSFLLSGTIKGWQEMVPLIKQGGSLKIIVPSAQAYGLEGTNSIPAFSPLDFDISVTDVTK